MVCRHVHMRESDMEAVMITAEGEMLSFRDHQRLPAEEAWSALQSGMSEETAQDVS